MFHSLMFTAEYSHVDGVAMFQVSSSDVSQWPAQMELACRNIDALLHDQPVRTNHIIITFAFMHSAAIDTCP